MKKLPIKILGSCFLSASFCFLLIHSLNSSSINAVHFLLAIFAAWSFYLYCAFSKIDFSIKQIVLTALFLRLIALFTIPLMEDDFFRYLWNGYQFVEIGQIRTLPPMDFFAADVPENMSIILSGINNPHLPSIYSPFTEYIFALSYLIAPGKLIVIKLMYLLCELLAFLGVYKLFNSKQLLLLLWNPLIIFETYVNSHPDIIAMCFLLLAWASFKQKKWFLLGLFLGLGFSSRFYLIVCIPLVLISVKTIGGFLLSSLAVYGPFLTLEKSFGSLGTFINEWEFNSSVFAIFRSLSSYETAKWICAVLLIIFMIGFWYKFFTKNAIEKSVETEETHLNFDFLFLGLFLLSAVFNPWYSIVFIPFIIMNKRYTLLLVPLALSLSYIHGLNMPSPAMEAYEIPAAVQIFEYFIICLALILTNKNHLIFLPGLNNRTKSETVYIDDSFKKEPHKENQ